MAAACATATFLAMVPGGSAHAAATPSPTPTPTPAPAAGPVLITGSGFGHGVGMSQYGAQGMALAGYTAQQILQHYYTGVSVDAVADTAEVRVNVAHRATSIRITPQAVPGTTAPVVLELLSRVASTVTLGVGDMATITPSGDGVSIAVTPSGSTTASTTYWSNGLGLRWSGPRRPVPRHCCR